MTHDNIFESKAQAIINTINCVGNMGGGLAKQFRIRYPDMNAAYQAACANGQVKIGKMWIWHQPADLIDPERVIINFPTKDDWRNPSLISYIEDGLKDLTRVIDDLHLSSVAVPALGCGLGGLDWNDVRHMLEGYAHGITHHHCVLHIYPPEGAHYTI